MIARINAELPGKEPRAHAALLNDCGPPPKAVRRRRRKVYCGARAANSASIPSEHLGELVVQEGFDAAAEAPDRARHRTADPGCHQRIFDGGGAAGVVQEATNQGRRAATKHLRLLHPVRRILVRFRLAPSDARPTARRPVAWDSP